MAILFYLAPNIFLTPKSKIQLLIILIIVICPIVRYVIFEYLPLNSESQKLSFINIQLISQLDAFSFGALAANISRKISKYKSQYIKLVICLSCIYIVYITYYFLNKNITTCTYMQLTSFGFESLLGGHYGYVWGYTLLNLTFGMIVIGIINFPSLFKFLRNSFLVNMGKLAYSIYLFHVPILEFTYYLKRSGIIQNRLQMGILFFILTYLFAQISWHLIEKQFLKMKHKI